MNKYSLKKKIHLIKSNFINYLVIKFFIQFKFFRYFLKILFDNQNNFFTNPCFKCIN